MSGHALLSPSSAYRWLNFTPAPRLEASLPDKSSIYAEEGTLAHNVCEIRAKKHFGKIKSDDAINSLKNSSLWNDEMLDTAETYVEHLAERAMSFEGEPYVTFEVRVDLADYVPESFGRCDCVMFGEDTLIITDYKHGKGVPVSAKENPQMMLYALGALKLYQPIFGNKIKKIEMCIDQPRLNNYESWNCSIDELLAWGESVKSKAQAAYAGEGEFHAGDWCRFCKANGLCKAQASQQISAFEDFAGVANPALLSPEETGLFLKKGETLSVWYEALKQSAFDKLMSGCKIPGYKIVEGRSSRTWTNQDAALEKLQAAGVEHAIIYDSVPKSLAKLEKMLGVTKFKELVGEFVTKPQGKPTLTTSDDVRKEFNGAVSDFANV
ncbi:MAG: DUF2800 domain-containing protein [Selenomonadaceae bacterium]|nr:DUF2800 domain-containing protein [Selenomonadaceae bacterium]